MLLQIKRMIVELYAATTQTFNETLIKDVRRALSKILFLNCDLWTSKVSGEKFIGKSSVPYFTSVQNVRVAAALRWNDGHMSVVSVVQSELYSKHHT